MNYYRMLNAGLEPSGDLNFFGVIKWMLGLLIIFILIQNYWELVSGKVYIFSYHRYKSKNRWLGTHTMKVLGICLLYSGIMAGINSFIDSFSVEEIIKQWLLYALFIFNMNYFFCMGHMSAKTKIFIWVLVFGIGAILCSVISERQYWNISSYGMLCQLICDSDYVVSVTANLIVTVFVVGIRLIISGGGFKNELHRSK